MEDDRRRDIALFRYSLIREAADPELSPRERGALVRRLAGRDHIGPDGQRLRVARSTLDRWIRDWRAGGYEALVPETRAGVPLTHATVLDKAERLKREEPRRTAAHIAAVLATRGTRCRPARCNAISPGWASTSGRRPGGRSAGSKPRSATTVGPATRCTPGS